MCWQIVRRLHVFILSIQIISKIALWSLRLFVSVDGEVHSLSSLLLLAVGVGPFSTKNFKALLFHTVWFFLLIYTLRCSSKTAYYIHFYFKKVKIPTLTPHNLLSSASSLTSLSAYGLPISTFLLHAQFSQTNFERKHEFVTKRESTKVTFVR